jgi:hypothetical protein
MVSTPQRLTQTRSQWCCKKRAICHFQRGVPIGYVWTMKLRKLFAHCAKPVQFSVFFFFPDVEGPLHDIEVSVLRSTYKTD